MIKWIAIYLICMNVIGLFLMWSDKRRARKHLWRIPEKTLFLASLAGGSIGTWLGMYLFRHKTRHWYFVLGMPSILTLQLGVTYFVASHVGVF